MRIDFIKIFPAPTNKLPLRFFKQKLVIAYF